MAKKRSARAGLGVLAVGGAIVISTVALVAGGLDASQPMAPAMIGGGGVLAAVLLGRWGLRALQQER